MAPGHHIDGVVVEQLQLRRKLRNVVARAGTRGQELIAAAPEAVQDRLGPRRIRVADLIAFVQYQLNTLVV